MILLSIIIIVLEIIILLLCFFIFLNKKKSKEKWDYDDFIKQQKCAYEPLQNMEEIPRFGGVPSQANFWPCLRTVPK